MALQLVHPVAVADGNTSRQPGHALVQIRLIGHQVEVLHAFGGYLLQDLRYGGRAFHRLAAGHGDRVIDENFVGDVDTGRLGCTNRQRTRVHVSAVAQVGKDVFGVGKWGLPDP